MAFSAIDLYNLERKAGGNAAKILRAGLRAAIAETVNTTEDGEARKATSRAVYKDNRLQRITIKAPHYIFKQHFGFEGRKKNGVNMRLRSTSVVSMALEKSNVLETLADDIANIRVDQFALKINFK
jgi:hypothetical protein